MSDQSLLRRFIDNSDNSAFDQLAQRHHRLVYFTALRELFDPHCAEDATQAVFILLYKKADSLRNRSEISSWLFQCTRLVCSDIRRAGVTRRRHENCAAAKRTLLNSGKEANMQRGDIPDKLEQEEQRSQLNDCLAYLNQRERQAVVLHYLEGLPRNETALLCACSQEALRKRLGRALDKLRRLLVKRGVVLSAAGCMGLLTAESAQAAPAGVLKLCESLAIKSCISMATSAGIGISAGSETVTSPALRAANGTIKSMFITKVKTAAGIALLSAAILTGAGVCLSGPASQSDNQKSETPLVAKLPKADTVDIPVIPDNSMVPLGKVFTMVMGPGGDYCCDLEKNKIWHGDEADAIYEKAMQDNNSHESDKDKILIGLYQAYAKIGVDIDSTSFDGHFLHGMSLIPVEEKYFDEMQDWVLPDKRYIEAIETAYGGDFTHFQPSSKRFRPTYLFKTFHGNCGIIQFIKSSMLSLSFRYKFLKTGAKNTYRSPLNETEFQEAQKYIESPNDNLNCGNSTSSFARVDDKFYAPEAFSLIPESSFARRDESGRLISRRIFEEYKIDDFPIHLDFSSVDVDREPVKNPHEQEALVKQGLKVIPQIPMPMLPRQNKVGFKEILKRVKYHYIDAAGFWNRPTGALVLYDMCVFPLSCSDAEDYAGVNLKSLPDFAREEEERIPDVVRNFLMPARAPTVSYIFPDAYEDFPIIPIFAYKTRSGVIGLLKVTPNPQREDNVGVDYFILGMANDNPFIKYPAEDNDVF